jgi:hypothetical protein
MTLDEAIKHAEEVMSENLEKTKGRKASDPVAINCTECAEQHRQLAEWLKELKWLRGKYARLRRECNEVIDEICRLREAEDDGR